MEALFVYAAGALLYGVTELIWRGWTHWSMLLCGGLCFSLMYRISKAPLCSVKKYVLSAAVITAVEFEAGIVLNLLLGWEIWDYSDMPLNLMGQICPVYSLGWLLLSVPGLALCGVLRRIAEAEK